jgi:hypothetical protein
MCGNLLILGLDNLDNIQTAPKPLDHHKLNVGQDQAANMKHRYPESRMIWLGQKITLA